MKNSLIFLAFMVSISACGKKSAQTVKTLPDELHDSIQQSLLNGHIPTRQEIKTGDIRFDNACETFRKKIPSDWFQDSIEVPENPADPSGQKIEVFYYGKIKEGVTPVVFFNGGPGGDSHGSFNQLSKQQTISDPENVISFIYIDQRGNGCSDYYPQGNTPEVLQRLTHYGTRGIVADAEAIRKKLGLTSWIAFGQSYGGFIVHKYAMIAKEGLKAAFSHAGVITENGYTRSFNRIKAQTRVLQEYLNAYPEDQKSLKILGEELNLKVCFKDQKSSLEVCGFEALDEIPLFLAFRTDWKNLHSWIKVMVKDEHINVEAVGEFTAAFYFNKYRESEDGNLNYNLKKHAEGVIGWADRDSAPFSSFNCRKIQDDLKIFAIDIESDVTSECAWAMQYPRPANNSLSFYKDLPRDLMTIKDFYTALKNDPIPFYLYSGELDQMVPRENFEYELSHVQQLSNFSYKHFLKTGHDGYLTEPQVWQDLIFEVRR
jgi:pimeloyl-ACP methyl ester carboxylesterase